MNGARSRIITEWGRGGYVAGRVHLLFQLGLGQQLWDEVQTDMDGGDACHS